MRISEQNYIRFTRSSIIIYPSIVMQLRLTDKTMLDLRLMNNHEYYIGFIPSEYRDQKRPEWRNMHQVNERSATIYTMNITDLIGDYVLTNETIVRDNLVYFKLKPKNEDDRNKFYQIGAPARN